MKNLRLICALWNTSKPITAHQGMFEWSTILKSIKIIYHIGKEHLNDYPKRHNFTFNWNYFSKFAKK